MGIQTLLAVRAEDILNAVVITAVSIVVGFLFGIYPIYLIIHYAVLNALRRHSKEQRVASAKTSAPSPSSATPAPKGVVRPPAGYVPRKAVEMPEDFGKDPFQGR